MSQEARQDLLIALSTISLLTTLSGSVFANKILGKVCPLFKPSEELRQLVVSFYGKGAQINLNAFRFGWHALSGVCGFGLITGAILCVFIAIQLSLIITFKDVKQYKKQRKNLAILTAIIISLYCVIQFLLNSSFNYFIRGSPLRLGLWEYMLPTYLLQATLLYLLFTEPNE
jgi:hypothetical protein